MVFRLAYLLPISLIIFTTIVHQSVGQNLVPNWDFESYNSCPVGPSQITNVIPWGTPDTATPDYYNICYTPFPPPPFPPIGPSMDVPSNIQGWQQARSGVGYVGIISAEKTFSFNTDYREYLQVQLNTPLVIGQTYCVNFYWSLADNSPHYVEEIGVYFSNTQINLQQSAALPFIPQLEQTGTPMDDTTNWVSFQQSYLAAGGEQYIIIGNFRNPSNTTLGNTGITCNIQNGGCFAYYYIEDVCVSADSICCSPPCSISLSSNTINSSCNGSCNGSGSVNPSGGSAPYSYQWDVNAASQTSQTATGLCAGSYTVTVTDGSVCTDTITITITEPSQLTINTITIDASCNGASDGSATATTSGGASPYQYSWSNGQLSSAASGLASGTYSVTVTDNNSCTNTANLTITEPAGIGPSIISTDENCGSNDGTASVNLSGGTSPFTFLWSNGQTSSTASALSAGVYTVTITDAIGCSEVSGIVINGIGGPTLSISSNDISCYNSTDGSATVNVVGGTPPYIYIWDTSPPQTNATAISLSAGTYNITVTDFTNPCSSTTSVVISEPSLLSISLSSTDALCYSGCDGMISVAASGGIGPYTYIWSNSASSSSINGLCSGNYSVTVSDSNGCDTIQTVFINQPSMILATGTTIAAKCGNNNGSATVTPSGGTPPYFFSWDDSNAQTTQTADSLISQSYNVTISDANGCFFILPVSIGFVDGPMIDTITSIPVKCFGDADGTASVSIINGTPPLAYLWDNGSTNSTNTGLQSGSYTVTITDLYLCDTVGTIIVSEPNELLASTSGTDTMCYGETGGVLTTVATGGSGQYSYIWNNLSTGSSISVSPITTTSYSVTVTDSNNCQVQDTSILFVFPALVASVVDKVICEGDSVTIFVAASFGNGGPYNYLWYDGSTNSSITVSPLANTNYSVQVMDGCSTPSNEAITVSVSPKPQALFSVACFPNLFVLQFNEQSSIDTGTITSWLWDFDDGEISTNRDPEHDYSLTSTYNVSLTVTSADGCTDLYTQLVQSTPTANFIPYPLETTTVNPVITFTDSSSNDVITWNWSFGDGDSTSLTMPMFSQGDTLTHTYDSSGLYAVTLLVMDVNGCVDTALDYINILEEYVLFAPNSFSPNGDGVNEEFMPIGIGINKDNFEMLIYNRWGDLIFKTRDYNNPWDGKANYGKKEAQADVYVWRITTIDPINNKHQYIGHITLLK